MLTLFATRCAGRERPISMLYDVSAGAVSVFDVLDADVELLAAVDAGTAAVGTGNDCESCESFE